MEYVGEYLIPLAAIVLVVVVWFWEDIAIVVLLVKRLIARLWQF